MQAGRRDEVVQREGAVGMVARMIPRLPDGSELIPTQISRSAMQRAGKSWVRAGGQVRGGGAFGQLCLKPEVRVARPKSTNVGSNSMSAASPPRPRNAERPPRKAS